MKKKIKKPAFFKNALFQVTLKIFLSFYILYHLAVVFVTPQRMSMLRKNFGSYFISYAQTLFIDGSWNFYIPRRSHYYDFKYTVMEGKRKIGTFRWPPSRREVKRIYLNHNRLISHSRFFMIIGGRNIRRHFIPYLCDLHPSADKITVKAILKRKPRLKNAFDSAIYDNKKEWFSVSSKCSKRKKARNIDSTLEEENNLIEDVK